MTKLKFSISNRGKVLIVVIVLAALSVGFISKSDKDYEIAKNLDIYITLFGEVSKLYVDDTDPEKLIESSINGMLETLDPYTTYIPEKDLDEFKFMTTGKYGGVGALIRKAGDYTMISEPYEGFPAQRSGLMAGDTIIAIDGISTKGKTVSDVSELLKGTPHTTLNLRVKRIGVDSVLTKTFTREEVSIPNVPYYGLMQSNIGYILLTNFTKDAGKEVKMAFTDLKSKGAKAIILDLRGNPGGLLNEAVNVANVWVSKNKEIVNAKGKVQKPESYKTESAATDTTMPLAILVNRGSASASEIVAGALQDLDRAIIVGEKTFGKGLVQTTRPLGYNTLLKITTAKYYIPSGRCIQAIDYSHRNEDGSVGYVPDSLKSEFKTRNGRSVFDGGGIDPDIKIENDVPGNITIALYSQNILFDFATVYTSEHSSIAPVKEFELTDDIYNSFLQFVKDKEFEYKTISSDKLAELEKTALREGYYDIIKDELAVLKTKLHGDKNLDLQTFKKEISELLKNEIASRYYYQKGRIESSLKDDAEVNKAIEILSMNAAVPQILKGTYEGETVFAISTIKK